MNFHPINVGRFILSLCLTALYGFVLVKTLPIPLASHWIPILDDFILITHEAGHFILTPLSPTDFIGRLIYILGGSLMQWLLPIVFLVYFVYKKNLFSSFVILFWLGMSVLNSVPYIADAENMMLPLLGGGNSIHDWNYILTQINLLEQTRSIAIIFYLLAIAFLTLSVLGSWFTTFWSIYHENEEAKQYRKLFQ